jgi:hypothetical protein
VLVYRSTVARLRQVALCASGAAETTANQMKSICSDRTKVNAGQTLVSINNSDLFRVKKSEINILQATRYNSAKRLRSFCCFVQTTICFTKKN